MKNFAFKAVLSPIVIAASLLVAGSVQAHAIVMESQPKVHDHLAAGAQAFSVHFNSRIDLKRSKLTLIAADRSEIPVTRTASPDDQTLTGTVAVPAAGEYRLRWQVLAVDGHTTRGDIPFTADAPAPVPAPAVPAPAAN